MIRPTALAAAVLLALTAASCGGDGAGGADAGKGTRIALVTDLGGLNDRAFNALANQGLKRAESELGVDDLEPPAPEQGESEEPGDVVPLHVKTVSGDVTIARATPVSAF